MPFLIGYDIGSSSIKASLLNAETGELAASASSPKKELKIFAPYPGWAEQDPRIWWEQVKRTTKMLIKKVPACVSDTIAIGISYQMHGLVIVDKNLKPLRNSIIWCDSRAVEIGEKAFYDLGHKFCLEHFLNSPGNFTASKLKWVMDNEPQIYFHIHKAMLPGDYIAMKMTGEVKTTFSGLSEGIFWDYKENNLSKAILDYFGLDESLIPEPVPSFSIQGELTTKAAKELGLKPGIMVTYRAGDQPNNALSLNVLKAGEIASTAGTSGVVYGVNSNPVYDIKSRVNTFLHVNHSSQNPSYGVLLCLNGTGILNRWSRDCLLGAFAKSLTYHKLNEIGAQAPAGSAGILILPFGNGAERMLENRDLGASIHNLDFNRHKREHIIRAVQEGIVFALNYGIDILRNMGINVEKVRAGYSNMFLSPLFTQIFASVTGTSVELFDTDGAQGAARGAGIGAGYYKSEHDAFRGLKSIRRIEPNILESEIYKHAYSRWVEILESKLKLSKKL